MNFLRSTFYTLYGRDCDGINSKLKLIGEKIDSLKNKNSTENTSDETGGKLRIMYTACGPIGKNERVIVDTLSEQGFSLRSFKELREKFGSTVGNRDILSAQYDVSVFKAIFNFLEEKDNKI